MGLRLLRWWHRDAVPAGRHVRVLPAAGVPGAAATIVSSASLDPRVTGSTLMAAPPSGPVVPLSGAEPAAPAAPAAVSVSGAVMPAPGPDGRHDGVPAEPAVPELAARFSSVGLVFADGASVELDRDDPRVRTFRAAAAALLEPRPS